MFHLIYIVECLVCNNVTYYDREKEYIFDKTSENPNCLIKEEQCKSNNIFR